MRSRGVVLVAQHALWGGAPAELRAALASELRAQLDQQREGSSHERVRAMREKQ